MQIRPATEEDFESIVRLVPSEEELFLVYPSGEHPFTIEQLRKLAESRAEFTVLLQEEEVIGFANLYNFESRMSVFIGNVVIDRAYRGAGHGRKLVEHMVEVAIAKYRVQEVRISAFSNNAPALLLYEGLGFRRCATEARQHPNGDFATLIHMRLAS